MHEADCAVSQFHELWGAIPTPLFSSLSDGRPTSLRFWSAEQFWSLEFGARRFKNEDFSQQNYFDKIYQLFIFDGKQFYAGQQIANY